MKILRSYLDDFLGLFFPELCAACGKNLFKGEQVICTHCMYDLPHTHFHLNPENRVARQLWGRIPFKQAGAFLYFKKGGKVQSMMHQLKYNNRPDIGFKLGELYGQELKQFDKWQQPDLLIPVPLYPARQKKRGYNQSEHIAHGLSASLQVPVFSAAIIRGTQTETQTNKSRFSRYENMKEAFIIHQPETLINKHILLVDDVITTGATLEACSLKLLEVEGLTISIMAIAFAE